ncbi:transcriptional regulator, TetR family [Modestobacter sp. DSM 44400]|uniref:TetR/AcrR family transcriptional regulator n=1 Tax=Modestobacter sp. DSM 44400 TaxID=1550230 RepID=UPI000894BA30|nr:TetR/AcrR family transcriptional regulator [Modestobacter sp. DSM 44400]SDY28978.1 transcriptional regulator, TetR family [Modestobacter sp. DSM 44400]
MPEPTTRRGKDTKSRIVGLAAALMYERGVNATSIEDILAASGTGKSQFYHYFSSKEELVAEVLGHQLDQVLQEQSLFPLDTWEGISAWFQAMVDMQQNQRGYRGCPLGSISSQLLDQGEPLRSRAADAFTRWESFLGDGLRAMQVRGLLCDDADPDTLAESTIAVLQGGYLLSSTKRDIRPMRHALAIALSQLRSYAPSSRQPR